MADASPALVSSRNWLEIAVDPRSVKRISLATIVEGALSIANCPSCVTMSAIPSSVHIQTTDAVPGVVITGRVVEQDFVVGAARFVDEVASFGDGDQPDERRAIEHRIRDPERSISRGEDAAPFVAERTVVGSSQSRRLAISSSPPRAAMFP